MIGDRLKELRLEKKLRQSDIAALIGVGRTTYTNYETGASEPDIETINKLALYFNTSSDYLLGRTNERHPKISNDDYSPDTKVLFHDIKKLTPEQIELVQKLIKEFINEE